MDRIPLPARVRRLPPPSPSRNDSFIAGAIAYGLMCLFVMSFLGVLLTAALTFLGNDPALGSLLGERTILFGLAMALSAGLCRLIGRADSDNLLSLKPRPGDTGIVGFLLGLVLVGWIAEREKLWLPGEATRTVLNAIDRIRSPRDPAEPPSLPLGLPMTVAGPTLSGEPFDSAGESGRVVLVDFWATWCPPCVAEIPNLKALHEEFHGRGLRIVGVNLDDNPAQVKACVERNGVPWPQIVFAEESRRGWDNPIAQHYRIAAIPRVMLIGPDGRLRHGDLHGPMTRWAVAAALGEPTGMPWPWRVCDWFLYTLVYAPALWLIVIPTTLAVACALTESYVRFRRERDRSGVILRHTPGALGS